MNDWLQGTIEPEPLGRGPNDSYCDYLAAAPCRQSSLVMLPTDREGVHPQTRPLRRYQDRIEIELGQSAARGFPRRATARTSSTNASMLAGGAPRAPASSLATLRPATIADVVAVDRQGPDRDVFHDLGIDAACADRQRRTGRRMMAEPDQHFDAAGELAPGSGTPSISVRIEQLDARLPVRRGLWPRPAARHQA